MTNRKLRFRQGGEPECEMRRARRGRGRNEYTYRWTVTIPRNSLGPPLQNLIRYKPASFENRKLFFNRTRAEQNQRVNRWERTDELTDDFKDYKVTIGIVGNKLSVSGGRFLLAASLILLLLSLLFVIESTFQPHGQLLRTGQTTPWRSQ